MQIGNKRLKVQHKQIRPAEQQNQDMNHGMHGGGGHSQHHGGGRGRGGRGGYGGRGGNNLPPMPSTGWYNNNDLNKPPGPPPPNPTDVTSADPQHVVVVLGDGPSNSNNVATADSVNTSAVVSGKDETKANADPLSSMDPLRQTLPDMGGVAAPAVSGEN